MMSDIDKDPGGDRDAGKARDTGPDVGREVASEVASEVGAAVQSVIQSVKTQGIVQSVIHWENLWDGFWASLPKNPQTGKLQTAKFTGEHWEKTEKMHDQCEARIVAFRQIGRENSKSADSAQTNMQMADDSGPAAAGSGTPGPAAG
jgi:hypothetical protein